MNTKPTVSAGVVIVRRVAGKWLYLLLRVYNFWDFPKGVLEAGESGLAAAKREAKEEAGIGAFLLFPDFKAEKLF